MSRSGWRDDCTSNGKPHMDTCNTRALPLVLVTSCYPGTHRFDWVRPLHLLPFKALRQLSLGYFPWTGIGRTLKRPRTCTLSELGSCSSRERFPGWRSQLGGGRTSSCAGASFEAESASSQQQAGERKPLANPGNARQSVAPQAEPIWGLALRAQGGHNT